MLAKISLSKEFWGKPILKSYEVTQIYIICVTFCIHIQKVRYQINKYYLNCKKKYKCLRELNKGNFK